MKYLENRNMELKVLKEWKLYTGQEQENIYDYISNNINPENVYLIGKYIYTPDIVKFEKGFFLTERISAIGYDVWMGNLNKNIIEVEKIINHIHIYDLFAHFNGDVDENIFLEIGKQMELSWKMYLKHKFPLEEFVINFDDGKNDYGPTITFYNKKPIR
jgi:hypothetical protein